MYYKNIIPIFLSSNRNLSAKLEYLHVSANLSDTVPFPAAMGPIRGGETDDVVRPPEVLQADGS